MKIAVVSCSKNKKIYPCESQEMYSESVLFKKAIVYINNNKEYDKWFILSAKYGLLKPNEIIEPYDLTLNNMKNNKIKEWSEKVFNQICNYNIKQIDFYAGEKYRKHLIPLLNQLNIKVNIPMKGLGIGQQLKFLGKEEK